MLRIKYPNCLNLETPCASWTSNSTPSFPVTWHAREKETLHSFVSHKCCKEIKGNDKNELILYFKQMQILWIVIKFYHRCYNLIDCKSRDPYDQEKKISYDFLLIASRASTLRVCSYIYINIYIYWNKKKKSPCFSVLND